MTLRQFALALPFVLGLVSCVLSKPELPGQMPAVDETAKVYNNDVRWGRYYEASAQLAPEQRAGFIQVMDDSTRPYRFTSVEMLQATPSDDGARVDMVVSLEYYRLPSVQEQKVQQRQTWKYDPAAKRWFVDPDLSVLGGPPPAGGSPVPASPER